MREHIIIIRYFPPHSCTYVAPNAGPQSEVDKSPNAAFGDCTGAFTPADDEDCAGCLSTEDRTQVRGTHWANVSLSQLYSHRNAGLYAYHRFHFIGSRWCNGQLAA